jgi:type IV pilus assembly protein PilV
MKTRSHSLAMQRGLTLIEILVSVVLISVGLLGVAALHVSSLKGSQESYARSQAAMLAADILDRMRANQIGFFADHYTVAFDGVGTTGTAANIDLVAWQGNINRLLPGGAANASGSISRNGNVVTVTVRWSERAERANMQTQASSLPTFTTRSEI